MARNSASVKYSRCSHVLPISHLGLLDAFAVPSLHADGVASMKKVVFALDIARLQI